MELHVFLENDIFILEMYSQQCLFFLKSLLNLFLNSWLDFY